MNQPIASLHRFCPQCGTENKETGRNPFQCPTCGYTHYFSPVAAVGAIIVDTNNRVLLITRARDPGKGKYGLPGGFVDPDESLEEALRREVLEEMNLQTTSIQYLISFPNQYAYAGAIFPVADAFFVCQVDGFETIKAQQGEITDYQFVHLDETVLGNMAFESNRRALQYHLSQSSDKNER